MDWWDMIESLIIGRSLSLVLCPAQNSLSSLNSWSQHGPRCTKQRWWKTCYPYNIPLILHCNPPPPPSWTGRQNRISSTPPPAPIHSNSRDVVGGGQGIRMNMISLSSLKVWIPALTSAYDSSSLSCILSHTHWQRRRHFGGGGGVSEPLLLLPQIWIIFMNTTASGLP